MKTCTRCGETRPLSDFSKGKRNIDGRKPFCVFCDRKYQAKYRLENAEKKKSAQIAWREKNREKENAQRRENPEKYRIHTHNRRALLKSLGKLTPGISIKLFELQKGKCACCKKPLGTDYHMDHIIPLALGGTNTDDNIQLLRAKCNKQKGAKHPIDFMQQRGFLL
jgi:5-methylcytosine-specific restriction endonuclease McrA